MTDTEDHEKLSDELEGQADELEQKSAGLEQEISDVKQDWERKRSDEGVPGANPPAQSEDETSGQGKDVPPERETGEAQADQSG
jgi:hypothetical protein